MDKIRVLIADDHPIVRVGVRSLLQPASDVEVVGEASDGREALEKTRELMPDVVIMDINMPDMNGLEATRQIKAHYPQVQVMALTIYDNEEYFLEMLNAGACGYVPKKAVATDLLPAVRSIYQAGAFLHPSVAKTLIQEFLKGGDGGKGASPGNLTEREKEILSLIAEGLTNQDIAHRLGLSAKTVDVHKEHIVKKLRLRSRRDLVKYAIHSGLANINPSDS